MRFQYWGSILCFIVSGLCTGIAIGSLGNKHVDFKQAGVSAGIAVVAFGVGLCCVALLLANKIKADLDNK